MDQPTHQAPTPAATVTQRLAWLDAARGIGIVLVVFGHAERGLTAAGLLNGPIWSWLDTSIYTFHMPLFMFLAGINVPGSFRRGRFEFLRDKVLTVAYPYFLWSIIQIAIGVLLTGSTNGTAHWQDLTAIGWAPVAPFWFLYVLFAYLLLVAVTGARQSVLVALSLAALVSMALVATNGLLQQILYFLPFFCAGMLLSGTIQSWHPQRIVLALAIMAALWFTSRMLLPQGRAPYISIRAIPCAATGMAFTLLLAQMLRGRLLTGFARLGLWSMSIYVMHVLATAGTRIILVRSGWPLPGWEYLELSTIAGVAGPVAVHLALQRSGLLPLFGLAKMPRRRAALLAAGRSG